MKPTTIVEYGVEIAADQMIAPPDAEHLELSGDIDGKPSIVRVRVIPRSSFLLVNRGFNWHQEYPFNR